MRIDSHQHFWHYQAPSYPWITERMRILQRDYLPAELEPLLQAEGVDGCIAVQACQSVEDTAFLLELARRHAFIKGVVGWVDLCSDRLDEQLARFAPDPGLSASATSSTTSPTTTSCCARTSGTASLGCTGTAWSTTCCSSRSTCRGP